MADRIFEKVPGNHWNFKNVIKSKSTGEPVNCVTEELDSVMVIKRVDRRDAPIILKAFITWENKEVGEGVYEFTPEETKDLSVGNYFYECYAFKDDGSYNKTINKGKLNIVHTLKKDIVPRT